MGNLDFSNHAGFSWYCLLLLISGLAMLLTTGVPGVSGGARIATLLFGAGFTIYALYLIFVFDGGAYYIFFKAFIVPIVVIIGAFKSAADRRNAKRQQQNFPAGQPPMGMPGQYNPQYGAQYGPQNGAPYGQPVQYGPPPVNGGYQPAASADAPTVAVPAQQPVGSAYAPTVAVPMQQQSAPQEQYPQQPQS